MKKKVKKGTVWKQLNDAKEQVGKEIEKRLTARFGHLKSPRTA